MAKQLEIEPGEWDKEFSSGRWNCLDDNPAERARHAIIGMYCQKYFPGGNILDVGCGEGTLVDFLSDRQKKKYLGIDISSEAIKIGKRKRRGMDFQCVEAESFETKRKFDVIVFNEVLYYLDDAEIFAKFTNFLKKGNIVILSLYRMKSERHDKPILKNSRKFFDFGEAIEVSGDAGGQNVTWRVEVLKKKSI